MSGQISPDGYWRWDGQAWVPNVPAAPPYPMPSYSYYAPPPPDGKAIASLVVSIAACGIGSIPAIVLGHLSRRDARRQGRAPSGMALAGLIIGYASCAFVVVFLALGFSGALDEEPTYDGIAPIGGPVAVALHSAGDAEQNFHLTNKRYAPTLTALDEYGYRATDGVDVVVVRATADELCLEANDDRTTYWLSTEDLTTVVDSPCS